MKHQIELLTKKTVVLEESNQVMALLLNDVALISNEEPLLKKRTKLEQTCAPLEPTKTTLNIPVSMKSRLEADTQKNLGTISEEKSNCSQLDANFFNKKKSPFYASNVPSWGNNQNETWGPDEKKAPSSLKKDNLLEYA